MMTDLRHAWRALRAMPLLATVVVASLAVGIGANTVVFSWLQMVRWKPLPGVRASGALVTIEPRTDAGVYIGASWQEFLDLQPRLPALEWVTAFRMTPVTVGDDTRPERAAAQFVAGNYFVALELQPAAGRFFRAEEVTTPGRDAVAVISHDYWRTRFGAAASAVGAPLRVNGETLRVIGVAPARFQGTTLGLTFDMWLPATMTSILVKGSRELEDRTQRGYTVVGRPRDGPGRVAAQGELDAVMRELAARYPDSNRTVRAELTPFVSPPRGPQRMFASALALLQLLMLLVLAAVCGNVTNLLLARASVRQREFGVRLALGASRWRVGGLVVLETLLMAAAGTAIGVGFAFWGTRTLRAGEVSGALPIRFETTVDLTAVAVAAGLGILAALAAAAAPAWFMARAEPQHATRLGARRSTRSPLRQTLMGLQVALALLVMAVAGLFVQRFAEGQGTDPGFRADGVLLAAYDLTGRGADATTIRQFAARVLEELARIPGVESAALAAVIPLDIHGLPSRSFVLEGRPRPDGDADVALSNIVSPGYLRTMGIALLEGQDFVPLDDVTSPPQVIVNDAFVQRYLGGAPALGRRLESRGDTYVIVGVAHTTTYDAFGEPPTPLVLYSYRDRTPTAAQMHVRTRPGAETSVTSAVRRVVAALDASLPVYDVRTLPEHIARNLVLRRVPAQMFLVLGPLLLLLAAIGIYAVVDYTVAQRRPEIGVRLALGARGEQVVRQIVSETMGVVALGAGAALAIAVFVELHLVRGGMRDIPVLVGVPAVLLLVAGIASWIPARHASRVDPSIVLRQL